MYRSPQSRWYGNIQRRGYRDNHLGGALVASRRILIQAAFHDELEGWWDAWIGWFKDGAVVRGVKKSVDLAECKTPAEIAAGAGRAD